MRTRAVAVLAIVSLAAGAGLPAAAGGADDEAVKKELAALAGTWKPTSAETDGRKLSDEELKDVTVTYDAAGKFSVRRGGEVLYAGTFKIDPAKKPKAIDYTQTSEGGNQGMTVLGIYEVQGDTLRVCTTPPGQGRPPEFSAKPGSGHFLRSYKREPK
jgi:uncharacterized protein (TIGR03067 family)